MNRQLNYDPPGSMEGYRQLLSDLDQVIIRAKQSHREAMLNGDAQGVKVYSRFIAHQNQHRQMLLYTIRQKEAALKQQGQCDARLDDTT
jgi:hypothetical protein